MQTFKAGLPEIMVSLKKICMSCFPVALASVLFFFCLNDALAKIRILRGPDPSILATEDGTKKEIERIEKLSPSKSSALNQESLGEARDNAEIYGSFSGQIAELEKIDLESVSARISDVLGKFPT